MAAMLAWPAALPAQQIVTSPAPDAVGVTLYRDPDRPAAQPLQLRWLNGFALVTETRRVTLPAGDVAIRFEGVAGGIVPESAIVTGLPGGTAEKNRDAELLSAATLLERSLGRRVQLRRTSRANGAVRDTDAIVRSGAEGAVVLETPDGIEALRCTGLNETLIYDGVPAGLSAKPTLSVRTRSPAPSAATITLSYLASGFDWQADYVATLSAAGDRMDLFAWMTLANGDETGFVQAGTQAVAGRLSRASQQRRFAPQARQFTLRCWPMGTTSDIALQTFDIAEAEEITVTGARMMAPPPPPPPPPPVAAPAMQAQQEELGDLKLYRIPEPVTLAARSQKQVAIIDRRDVKVRIVHRSRVPAVAGELPVRRIALAHNRAADGLGLPLPAGRVALFQSGAARPLLIGSGAVADKAVGEDVEIDIGPVSGLTAMQRLDRNGRYALEVANDRAEAMAFEAELDNQAVPLGTRLGRRNGRPLWQTTIPANGRSVLRYRLRKSR